MISSEMQRNLKTAPRKRASILIAQAGARKGERKGLAEHGSPASPRGYR
jgi:hypothetical protein